MTSATVTRQGQVTIPQEILDYLKLDTGSRIDFVIDADGQIKVIPLNVPAKALSGILHRPGMKVATIEEMEQAIAPGCKRSDLIRMSWFAT